ncbi:LOW QUALITY PROTEIN: adhesion G protein-coupled receptor F5-like [Anarrhichthys ocellatus]|uniref:LOW QUALITY PROTEIN: adhesion G protein-coupled receptor F5-like n=1 Tax=Anarrhichthys ocellatus TaxID=433405 RepID=UPI0012ED6DF7|nr:LOW QUALITY PROTEIN: adhesion G protein-coupled receptor F5-like [Anarrhichthys ocellatus]
MAIPKHGLVIIALLLTTIILETGNFSRHFLPVQYEEEHFVSHIREKRTVTTDQWNYIIEVVVNVPNVETIQQIRSALNATSFPKALDNSTEISDINITTVCSAIEAGFQCRCEEHFALPNSICVTYGACDGISSGICKCIHGIPADGQFCQSISALLTEVEYAVDVELNVTDIEMVDYLRGLLKRGAFTLALGPTVNVTHIDITTVCFPNGTNFQCRCEEQYVWSHDNCITYGACDEIIGDTCGCINSIPTNGQYCQPQTVFYEYQIFIEVKTTEADQLRNTLNNIPFPVQISSQLLITEANITTVCSQDLTRIQCQCEDDYLWPCDKCATYGKCDGNTSSTCRCIKAFPIDGQYCQSISNQNFTTCPQTTTSPSTVPPVLYEYVISVELNISDVTLINALLSILSNIIYPVSINNDVQIYGVNISTVCSPSSAGYQCRCEDQYRWSCDQCLQYGSCDNITEDTCGCISAIPPDGQHCQPADQHNFTACPISTTTPSTTATTGVITTAVTTTTTTIGTTPTPKTATSTKATTTTTTRVSPTISTTTDSQTEFNVEMSVELNKTYTDDLNNASSFAYKDLRKNIRTVLFNQYKGITGFVNVSVTGFREGSIITDFDILTTEINPSEVDNANKNLPEAMLHIASVIGSVTALFNSQTRIVPPGPLLTGEPMKLMCEDNLNEAVMTGSVWKLNGKKIEIDGRITKTDSGLTSSLQIENVILRDIGRYECTLTGGIITFRQKGDVTDITQAPNIRLRREVNAKCKEGETQPLECCVQSPYKIEWVGLDYSQVDGGNCIKYDYSFESCSVAKEMVFTCKVKDKSNQDQTRLNVFIDDVLCDDPPYGDGKKDDESSIECDEGLAGFKKARCQLPGEWKLLEDTCIVTKINELLIASENLNEETVPEFVANLSMIVRNEQTQVSDSPATISAIVDIIGNIANIGDEISASDIKDVLQDVLETVDVIIGDDSRESWEFLNANETSNTSSSLLGSMETLASRLVEEVNFTTPRIILSSTTFNNCFMANLNSSVFLELPDDPNLINVFITTITFATLNNVMPARNSSLFNATNNETVINAAVVLVQINMNETIQNVTLRYRKLNKSLSQVPQCVFWNFTVFNNLGGWDDEGCTFISDINDIVTCNCNHLTSFSILMATDIPPGLGVALDIITYVGVAISLASLVICLIIEGYVWKAITRNSTAFMRHVSIINTALSLLIANICFIIGASIAKNPLENPGENFVVPVGPCSTATFFMHFFYLAVFFWMLVSGLLLFYRTVMVFSHMSRSTMLGIGFLLGYGCPLIIAVITVAVTAPGNGYIRKDKACWLNWFETHALLALVIPALVIVSINLIIVIVVLFKMLRRGVGDAAQTDERHTLVVILRCVVILTPLFGLTWALGIGTMISSTNKGIHIAFAFFNSLQGFFILVFGTLFDSKIRSILSRKIPTSSTGSNNTTRSTSGGIASHSGLSWINRLRGRRYMYHLSEAANSRSNGASESFSNI